MAEYDEIAEKYRNRKINLFNYYVRQETYAHILGDFSNLSVLDLACGYGVSTRIFKPDAARVVGVDISKELIDFAQREEINAPLGIEYITRNVLELDIIGDGNFDLVVAVQLLHYAQSKEQLLTMCQNIYANLKEGGRFITVNGNYAITDDEYKKLDKYGVPQSEDIATIEEGSAIVMTFTKADGSKRHFNVYYFTQETYRWALQTAGFNEVHWHTPVVSPEGVREFGAAFWQDAIDYPMDWFIECKK